MLLQGHEGGLRLLGKWKLGQVRGLRARGGYTVDIAGDETGLEASVLCDADGEARLTNGRRIFVRVGEIVVITPDTIRAEGRTT